MIRVVFLGATQGMGRALARLMAERGDELFLLARGPEDAERTAADLAARHPQNYQPEVARCDLATSADFEPALAAAWSRLGRVDVVVVTAALFATQERLEEDLELTGRLLQIDFGQTVLLCEHARRRLLAQGGGKLCVFSSVAGERGRKPVVLYGAAKAGLSCYLEALDHRYRAAGLETIAVKPGFVKTGMTADLDPPPFAGEPMPVAAAVLKAIDRGTPEVYVPGVWRWIMMVIRALPRAVMRRVGF